MTFATPPTACSHSRCRHLGTRTHLVVLAPSGRTNSNGIFFRIGAACPAALPRLHPWRSERADVIGVGRLVVLPDVAHQFEQSLRCRDRPFIRLGSARSCGAVGGLRCWGPQATPDQSEWALIVWGQNQTTGHGGAPATMTAGIAGPRMAAKLAANLAADRACARTVTRWFALVRRKNGRGRMPPHSRCHA